MGAKLTKILVQCALLSNYFLIYHTFLTMQVYKC